MDAREAATTLGAITRYLPERDAVGAAEALRYIAGMLAGQAEMKAIEGWCYEFAAAGIHAVPGTFSPSTASRNWATRSSASKASEKCSLAEWRPLPRSVVTLASCGAGYR